MTSATLRPITLLLAVAVGLQASPSAGAYYGASMRLVYDAANQGLNGGNGYKTYDNASGTLAWGESYIMMSYAAMYRATGEASYLVTLVDHALHVLESRDSVKGLKDFAGKSRPCWQSSKYSADGKGYCWVVHSGMITYPMADLVLLVNGDPKLKAVPIPTGKLAGKTLGQAAAQIATEVEKVVATHDFQYKSGPAAGEGHYRGDPAATATAPTIAGKALPLNQMNAMGRTLVALWKATGKAVYQQKAKALAAYLHNRMALSGQGYVWTYWGTTWSQGKGEDISHAAINVDFAALCQQHGLVFTTTDLRRLGRTLFDKVHRSTDAVADLVDGSGSTGNYKWSVGRWLNLTPHEARVWPVAANILRGTTSTSSGSVLLGLANVARWAPPLREYTFYHVDWKDLGTHRRATAYGANILILPTKPTERYALKLGYRAGKLTWVDQWDGKAYNHDLRLAPATGSAFTWVYVPYDPKIYHAYSGAKALYQFTDSFVSGQGIEVKEVAPVTAPTIPALTAPPATVGTNYQLTAKGSGDAPLLWSISGGPAGLRIGLKTGLITWTPTAADLPGIAVTLRLINDSGEATLPLAIKVSSPGSDAGVTDLSGEGEGGAGDAATDYDAASSDGASRDLPAASGDAGPATTEGEGCACQVGSEAGAPAGGTPAGGTPLALVVIAALLARLRRRNCTSCSNRDAGSAPTRGIRCPTPGPRIWPLRGG
jgi:hypothetical protein